MMAYPSPPHESTGCSQNLMMLGQEVSLPLDVVVVPQPWHECHYDCEKEYVKWLRQTLLKVHEFDSKQPKVAAARQKSNL